MGGDQRPVRHIVFSPSARGSLLQALKSLGRSDEVVALFDDLRCGPLDLDDLAARERWFDDVLRIDFEPGLVTQWHKEFWPMALDPERRLRAWTTRYATQDHVGYLAWASRLGATDAEVVDISDVLFPDWRDPSVHRRQPVPLITPKNFIEARLIDLARPLTPERRALAQDELARNVEENGAFRAIRDGRLISLPLDAYDDRLVGQTVSTLRKAARVIGGVLMDMREEEGWPVGDLALASRLTALVEAGRLEAVGDIYGSIRYWEVRQPQS